jgi:hypothetical protein
MSHTELLKGGAIEGNAADDALMVDQGAKSHLVIPARQW